MRVISTSAAAVVFFVAVAVTERAQAADLRYDYLEGGYQSVDLDNPDVDGDGLFVAGSVLVTQSLFLAADVDFVDFDRGVDARSIELGGGVRLPVAPGADVVLGGGYVDAEIDTRFGDFDDDGLFVRAGVRWLITEQVELNGVLKYVDLDDSGDDLGGELGVVIHLQPQLALLAGVELADDADAVRLGLRYHFRR